MFYYMFHVFVCFFCMFKLKVLLSRESSLLSNLKKQPKTPKWQLDRKWLEGQLRNQNVWIHRPVLSSPTYYYNSVPAGSLLGRYMPHFPHL